MLASLCPPPCLAGPSLTPLHFQNQKIATPTLSSALIFAMLGPFVSLLTTSPPDPLRQPDPNTHPASPPPTTAASRHWTGPPHLPGEVHAQCGKLGAVHITNHTGCLNISGCCNFITIIHSSVAVHTCDRMCICETRNMLVTWMVATKHFTLKDRKKHLFVDVFCHLLSTVYSLSICFNWLFRASHWRESAWQASCSRPDTACAGGA